MQSHDQKNVSVARGKFHIYPTIIALSIFLCLSAVSYGQSIDAQKIVSKTVDLRDDVKLEVIKQERLPEDAVEHITPDKIGLIQRQVENIELVGLQEIESQEETIVILTEIPESEKKDAVITGSPDLVPYKPSGWSDKIVVSNVLGTNAISLHDFMTISN